MTKAMLAVCQGCGTCGRLSGPAVKIKCRTCDYVGGVAELIPPHPKHVGDNPPAWWDSKEARQEKGGFRMDTGPDTNTWDRTAYYGVNLHSNPSHIPGDTFQRLREALYEAHYNSHFGGRKR